MNNLFSALVKYAPSESVTPRENFLTQALLFLLFKDNSRLAMGLCRLAGGKAFEECKIDLIRSQAGYQLERELEVDKRSDMRPERCVFDLLIKGRSKDDRAVTVAIENKWDSRLSKGQLERYLRNLEVQAKANKGRALLIFISPIEDDLAKADLLFGGIEANARTQGKALRWSSIVDLVEADAGEGEIRRQFVEFLDAEGLGRLYPIQLREVIGLQKLPTAVAAKKFKAITKPLLNRMISIGSMESWFTIFGSPVVSAAWGRACIWFGERWFVSFGILYNVEDHKTVFLDSRRPLDIVFRVQQNPSNLPGVHKTKATKIAEARNKFSNMAQFLKKSGYVVNRGSAFANGHTVLLAQRPFPWTEKTAEGQVDVLLSELKKIAEWLVDDIVTKRLIKNLNPYSD